jgi:5'-methylthioadenosine phosphorylase
MKLGIIGGSGLYEIDGLKNTRTVKLKTPFGSPSDAIIAGKLFGTDVFFLPRHGKGHHILPRELNHRANIFALKKLGATHIISISAVGSLKEEIKPKDILIVDQYLDRTKQSESQSFFGNGIVAHIAFADPVCSELRQLAYKIAEAEISADRGDNNNKPSKVHARGTYLNMEGPAFSTKAESFLYRSWGIDVIGMTNVAEAKLAREAEICYCTLAMVTDYDCWHPDHDSVTVEMIIGNLLANAKLAKKIISKIAEKIPELKRACLCPNALKNAIITSPSCISEKNKIRLEPIIGKYIPQNKKAKK